MAYLIVEKGSNIDINKVFSLEKERLVIGRVTPSSNPDIVLTDDYVSRSHIELYLDGNCVMLRDLGSQNGTQLNGKLIVPNKSYPLKDNTAIGVGIVNGVPRVILRYKETDNTIPGDGKKDDEVKPVTWLTLDKGRKEAWVDGKPIALPVKEYRLLFLLYCRAGNYCSRDEIIDAVWYEVEDKGGVSDAAIDALVHRVREKIEPNPAKPKRIVSKKGFGYLLEP